jgi:hypothetical protein
MTAEQEESFKQLIQANKLWLLDLSGSKFTSQLSSLLAAHWSHMTSLRNLWLWHIRIVDEAAFGEAILASGQLRLHEVSLQRSTLSEKNFSILCSVIPKWSNIELLSIRGLCIKPDNGGESCSSNSPQCLRELFRAIVECKRLTKLWLDSMHTGDNLIQDVCAMILSLQCLRELSLRGNNLSAEALRTLAQCLKQRRRNIEQSQQQHSHSEEDSIDPIWRNLMMMLHPLTSDQKRARLQVLDIRFNEGSKDEETVKQLQKLCNLVRY